MPRVSVIIPTYNSVGYLIEAIESVFAQTYSDFEILVVDDGSTDTTANVMRSYGSRLRYLQQANAGVSAARNRGISESTGEYVAFLDADDTWFPEKLALQMRAIAESGGARVCYSAFWSVSSDLEPLGINRSDRKATALEDLLLRGNVVGSICTVVAERSLLDTAGGFDAELSQCADWDMWVRLAAHSEFVYIDEPLVTYRQHESNMSRNAPLLEKDSLRVLEKGFAVTSLPDHIRRQRRMAFARNYMVLAGTYFHARDYRAFARCAVRAVTMDARQARYLLGFPARIAARSSLAQGGTP